MTKDYYQILEVSPKADPGTIKKSFRRLAHRFHPDKNQDHQPFSATHYLEIQEAYNVLSDPKARSAYDQERWMSGITPGKNTEPVTPAFLLQELQKLNRHLERIDIFRMSQESLSGYLQFLLSDRHLSIINAASDARVNQQIITESLRAMTLLSFKYTKAVFPRLKSIISLSPDVEKMVLSAEQLAERRHFRARLNPLIIVLVTLILCLAMFFFSRKGTS